MRIAHLADAHLGFRQYHRQTRLGINQREADVAQAFRATIDGVLAAAPDAVLVAGDLFHSVRPTNAAIVFAFQQLQRLREGLPDAPIVLIAGNHDTPRSAETGTILKLFAELGLDVALGDAERFVYPRLDLSVLAVPHQALVAPERPELRPQGTEGYQVLVAHGLYPSALPAEYPSIDFGGAQLSPLDIASPDWTYVALGHFHTRMRVKHATTPLVWYSGSLEYTSPFPWGELMDETRLGHPGKAWLLVDLDRGTVEHMPVPGARKFIDLKPLDAEGLSAAELDALIVERVLGVRGGIADQVVRLVAYNVPRSVARDLDHAAIRGWKADALHFHLDLRRPEETRLVGVGSPGRRQTLPELVSGYLSRRLIPADIERDRFVREGLALIDTGSGDGQLS